MDFTIIVPCFNNEPFLERCLGALSRQSWPRDRYETILIDNNSTDGSVATARRFQDVTVLEEPVQGSYAARNRGLRQARGRFLAFTDSDCEVCPTWLEEMASALAEPGAALALGQVRFLKESFSLSMVADYLSQKAQYVWSHQRTRLCYAYTNNMAVRREAFERCGPFVQIARGGDVVFASQVVEAYGPESVRYAPNARVRHLEITCVADWLERMSTYGRSLAGYRKLSRTEPLSFADRWEVMWQTIARNHYSLPRAVSLAGLLAVGVLAYDLNRIRQSMRSGAGEGRGGRLSATGSKGGEDA